eukprot:gnl/Dysnectes_brevis/4276_a5666_824.p1 GENE.gnl/Dysnectes_brevis/4276_a5666_824~~gnl/Dysnectes_brevis/4276_a5666_824.p1  ORF type:complete len:312 (-),score=20.87 gnl/Dysnectes_brevis/4276_a5666_824:79-1014(-)
MDFTFSLSDSSEDILSIADSINVDEDAMILDWLESLHVIDVDKDSDEGILQIANVQSLLSLSRKCGIFVATPSPSTSPSHSLIQVLADLETAGIRNIKADCIVRRDRASILDLLGGLYFHSTATHDQLTHEADSPSHTQSQSMVQVADPQVHRLQSQLATLRLQLSESQAAYSELRDQLTTAKNQAADAIRQSSQTNLAFRRVELDMEHVHSEASEQLSRIARERDLALLAAKEAHEYAAEHAMGEARRMSVQLKLQYTSVTRSLQGRRREVLGVDQASQTEESNGITAFLVIVTIINGLALTLRLVLRNE